MNSLKKCFVFIAVLCFLSCVIDIPLTLAWVGFGLTAISQKMSPCYEENWFFPIFEYLKYRDLFPVPVYFSFFLFPQSIFFCAHRDQKKQQKFIILTIII